MIWIKTKDKLCIGLGFIEKECKKMDSIQGKHFSITDPQGVNTVIYSQ